MQIALLAAQLQKVVDFYDAEDADAPARAEGGAGSAAPPEPADEGASLSDAGDAGESLPAQTGWSAGSGSDSPGQLEEIEA
jgi:hypothetical protein